MIAIYITTENMTAAKHIEGRKRLQEAGAPEDAMKLHSVFGEEGKLGITLSAPPTIMPVVDLVQ